MSSLSVASVNQRSMFPKPCLTLLGTIVMSATYFRFVRRTFEGVGVYKERLDRTIKLPTFSAVVVERVIQYMFEDFILNQCTKPNSL
jgi:hypothetical protein